MLRSCPTHPDPGAVQVQVHLLHKVQVVEERSIPVVKSQMEEVNNPIKGTIRLERCRMCAGSTLLQVLLVWRGVVWRGVLWC